MAVVFMEGCDHLPNTSCDLKGWIAPLFNGTASGRFAGQAWQPPSGTGPTHLLPSTYTTAFLGFGWKANTVASGVTFAFFRSSATDVVRLSLEASTFRLQARNASGTLLATGTTTLTSASWYYIELKCVVSATVGVVEVRLNGVSEIVATNVNTGALAIDTIGFIGFAGVPVNVDDIYVVDTSGSAPTNDFLGDVKVETLYPNGNGTNTAWTGVYTDWDDPAAHDTDTTYISSATPGDRETSTLTDLATVSGTVFAVQTNLVGRKDDAGTRTIAPVVRVGGVNYDGTTTGGLTASYLDYTQLYDRLDPSGAGWTISTVNAMETGVKEIA